MTINNIRNFITTHFLQVIIMVLCIVVLLSTCKRNQQSKYTHSDTTIYKAYVVHDTVYSAKPILIKAGRDTVLEKTLYLPSGNYDSLVLQFKLLKEELLAKNIYEQTIKYDSSSVTIKDTVQNNKNIGRKVDFNLKYPTQVTTITNTIKLKPKNKLFIGGELGGGSQQLINLVEVGVLFQNKRDNIYKAGFDLDFNGNIIYKAGMYKKIKLINK